jgi:hypothetical protein
MAKLVAFVYRLSLAQQCDLLWSMQCKSKRCLTLFGGNLGANLLFTVIHIPTICWKNVDHIRPLSDFDEQNSCQSTLVIKDECEENSSCINFDI